jgi:hypothetical protein
MDSERQKFKEEEWPATLERIQQLGLDLGELLQAAQSEETTSHD